MLFSAIFVQNVVCQIDCLVVQCAFSLTAKHVFGHASMWMIMTGSET